MSLQAHRYRDHVELVAMNNQRPLREATSTHHRKPRSIGGTDAARNCIELCTSKHRAWHAMFYNYDAHRIAREINDKYLDPDYEFVVVRRISS